MLSDALDVLRGTKTKGAGKGQAALDRAWVMGAPAQLPFHTVCEALGLDEGRTRAGLLRLTGT